MQYTQDSFFNLMDRVADQGGSHRTESCGGHREFMMSGERGPSVVVLRGHDKAPASFDVPYEGAKKPVKLCAVDDALGAMPRFGGDEQASYGTLRLFALHGDRLYANDPRVLGE